MCANVMEKVVVPRDVVAVQIIGIVSRAVLRIVGIYSRSASRTGFIFSGTIDPRRAVPVSWQALAHRNRLMFAIEPPR